MTSSIDTQYKSHFQSFDSVWSGGYFEGDPLDPLGSSKYRRLGYISVLYAIYIICIKHHIKSDTVALEIGSGRGAWTKCMLSAKEVWCLDAKSRKDNNIDEYLGYPNNLTYHQVADFSCSMLPKDTFSYMFSFGCLCHVPWEGVRQYAFNIFPKLKSGAEAFWMVADYDKRNKVSMEFSHFDIIARTLPPWLFRLLEWLNGFYKGKLLGPSKEPFLDKDEDQQRHDQARWYHSGARRTADMLREVGYEVISEDIEITPRDAILHFKKP